MWITITVLALVVITAVAWLATLEGCFHVKRSREIAAPTDSVFAAITDFKSWPEWSPWLMHEPDSIITYSENYQQEGGFYCWDGQVIGAGKLTHEEINPPRNINQQIEFLRPFKSVNQIRWSFEEQDDTCLVTWEMIGNMPFLFRFMTSRMEPMIGRDYELGLSLLNGYMNASAPHPELAFVDNEVLQDFYYWAIPCHGNLRMLEASRPSNIDTLEVAAGGKSGLPFTIFHQFNPLKSDYQAEVAIPVTEHTPQSNYTRRKFSGGRYFKMTLHGDHQFLPLAWYALSSHCRMHKIKLDKSRPSLEIYHNDPAKTADSNQLVSALYLAIK